MPADTKPPPSQNSAPRPAAQGRRQRQTPSAPDHPVLALSEDRTPRLRRPRLSAGLCAPEPWFSVTLRDEAGRVRAVPGDHQPFRSFLLTSPGRSTGICSPATGIAATNETQRQATSAAVDHDLVSRERCRQNPVYRSLVARHAHEDHDGQLAGGRARPWCARPAARTPRPGARPCARPRPRTPGHRPGNAAGPQPSARCPDRRPRRTRRLAGGQRPARSATWHGEHSSPRTAR